MFYPKVSGIIATDINGNIANSSGKPVLHGTDYEMLDRKILREYLFGHMFESGRQVVVCGENTYNDMKGLFSGKFRNFVVSSSTGIKVSRTGNDFQSIGEYDSKRDVKKNLFNAAFTEGFHHRANIFVLGGKSVYETFARHYSHFIHVMCMNQVDGSHTNVNVEFKGVRQPDQPHLITRDMNLPTFRIMDNGHIRVTEFNAWE